MWRRAGGVSGSTDVAKHGASCNRVADCKIRRVPIEVRVVINSPARTDHGNCLSAEIVLAYFVNISIRGGEYRRSFWCEDILAFVLATGTTWRVPGVGNLTSGNVFERH